MAYQLKFPTVDEFIRLAEKQYEAKLKVTTILGPQGREIVRYLERVVDGKVLQAPLQKPKNGMLYRNDVRSLCVKLKIPTTVFDDCFDSPMERYFDDFGNMIDSDEPPDDKGKS